MPLKFRKLTLAAMLCAVGIACSTLYIPVGASKCFPAQAVINVIAAVLLGPYYAVACAFTVSLLRNLLGMGTLLAFPGSMIGALLAAMLYKKFKNGISAVIGEVIGTGLIGALASYPVAAYIMGKKAAVFAYVLPFILSSAAGAVLAWLIYAAMNKAKVWDSLSSKM